MRKLSIILAVLLALATVVSCNSQEKAEQKAKYVFLFIGDGMGTAHVATAESYLSYKAGKLGGEQLLMTTFPYYGSVTTHSADHNVTCSSAAGTAIACGEKANNGTVGINKDSVNVESVAYVLQKEGYKVGIISTVPINHATPAAFYANNVSRGNGYEISADIIDSGFEFYAGAGFLEFKGKDGESEATDAILERNGYSVSYGLNEFRAESIDKEKVIFCQASNKEESADNYTSGDKVEDDITLGQMLELGMEFLGTDEPFFFMCEGGAIDWSAHGNLTMPMIENILEFDDAIKIAYNFYLAHPEETLIVVTADHETGGLTLGAGNSMINWEALESEWIGNGKKSVMDSDENRKFNKKCSIGWTTGSHTGGAVPMYAIGAGAEKFNGRMDNTEIKGKILCE